MARTTAPSLWLPGFDPDEPEFARPSPEADLFAELPAPEASHTAASQAAEAPTGIILPSTEAASESPASPSPSRSSWRVIAGAKRDEPRVLWPALRREHLAGLSGAVTKFDANLAAIRALQALESGQRAPDAEERGQLLRFTGWGGLPAAFNLEGGDPAWRRRAEELQALLPAEDYDSARASVNNSHYTEVHVIEAMWQAVERFGFTGGRVLEPAAGVGHFLGAMPRALAEQSALTAVEIDQLSGRLLQTLYGPHGADVRIVPFEKLALPENWFDLVIGNVPFGNYQVADTSTKAYARFRIHNYFFGRALDLVRPGGLVCFITSTGTMEARADAVREHIASQAELLGAIRLPMGAFAGIASTDVQTDILFLRKRKPGEAVSGAWLERVMVPDTLRHPRCAQKYLQINAWYARHPDFCIGRVTQESNGYEEVPTVVFEGDLEPALAERVALLPSGVYEAAKPVALAAVRATVSAEPGARPGSYRVHHGRVHRVEGTELVDLHDSLNATQRARIAGLCAIRGHARTLLDAQLAQDGDEGLAHLRALLNGTYDRYVARHGCLSTRANALAFRRDPDYPLLLSLEHYDEESDTARKAALFTQRTLRRVSAPTAVSEPAEALATSVQWRGRVDPTYMARLLSAPEEEVLAALTEAGQIFLDPADNAWKASDEYLSGNVKEKLKQAALSGPAFRRNVEALERVQPEDLEPAAIEPRLGAVWIPAGDVEGFVHAVLELKDCQVAYSAEAGAWSVTYPEWSARQNVKVTQEWGTPRMNAIELVQAALNVQVPTVRDAHPTEDRYVVNPAETLAAREKLGALKDRFASWAFEDNERRERPDGQVKFPHPWPPQIPPGRTGQIMTTRG